MKPTCLHDISPQEYEDNLREVITHARPFEYELLRDTGSPDLAALALVLNPHTRVELWDTLTDDMRGFVRYYESWCVDEESTQRMLKTVCRNVTQDFYRQDAERIVGELIQSIRDDEDEEV